MSSITNTKPFQEVLEDSKEWKIPQIEKKHLEKFSIEYANGRITGRIGKNVNGSIVDVLYKLKLPLEFFKEPVDKIEEREVKKFFDNLMSDKLKKKVKKKVKGKLKFVASGNYEKKGKDKFLKALRLYLKYRLEKQPKKLVKFNKILSVVITHSEREVKSLSPSDFDKLYECLTTLSDKFYILVNVWGGFRASEFHGITLDDVKLPDLEKGEEFVKIWIKHDNSKTKGRMIALYGKDCLTIVSAYVEQRKLEGIKNNEILYNKTHNSRKLWLRRLGIKLNLQLHPHLFRSTCATWLVDKGILKDYTDLCLFFGWYFGSPTPSKYLNRGGIKLKLVDENVKKSKIDEVERLLENEKEKNRLKDIRFNKEIDLIKKIILSDNKQDVKLLRDNLIGMELEKSKHRR